MTGEVWEPGVSQGGAAAELGQPCAPLCRRPGSPWLLGRVGVGAGSGPLCAGLWRGAWLHVAPPPRLPPEEGRFAASSILCPGGRGPGMGRAPRPSLLRRSAMPWSSTTAGTSPPRAASGTCRLRARFASPGWRLPPQSFRIAKLLSAAAAGGARWSLRHPPASIPDGAGSSRRLRARALSLAVPESRAACRSGAAICC